ncbi:hypothetical protein Golob_011959, partial [Gossypium lobatum]|nr:hypothetical protein [Gossypium lobatum]
MSKQNVDFWGPLVNLRGLPVDTVKSNIRDDTGKTSDDRHLTLFAFFVYGLIVFPKALGYVT